MKTISLLSVLTSLALFNLCASDAPAGSLLELHSCELYAGGCIVSSQATLDGRYMLRAWNLTSGEFAGQKLAGLQVALLQCSSENLAEEKTTSEQTMVYLPDNATAGQREALLSWIKSSMPELKTASFRTRVMPLHFGRTETGYAFTAGKAISVVTAPIETCETGGCGEALWYSPRSETTYFTVAANRSSRVSEPAFKLTWADASKRSVFLGRFGQKEPARNLYVTAEDLCGPARNLF
jgi:hypothetical protein